MRDTKLLELAEAAEREIDTEFETASLAMMRAFEAFQRYNEALDDANVEDLRPWTRRHGLDVKYDVALSLHMILRAIGVSPTGPLAARVVRAKLDECDLERCVIDGEAHPPTREAVIAGLTYLIAERERQMDGFVTHDVALDIGPSFNTDASGIAAAFRKVRRERDAFVLARDYA